MVVGVPGVGKTTVLGRVADSVPGAKVVNFGTVMLERGIKLGWIKSRDQLRKMSVRKQRLLQAATARQISVMKEDVVMVDTHLFIRTREGFWPGLPFDVVTALKPTHLVLVEAAQEEIARRRKSDRTRYRDDASAPVLEEELSLARQFMVVTSTLTGAPMLIVSNERGDSEGAASRISDMLKEVSK